MAITSHVWLVWVIRELVKRLRDVGLRWYLTSTSSYTAGFSTERRYVVLEYITVIVVVIMYAFCVWTAVWFAINLLSESAALLYSHLPTTTMLQLKSVNTVLDYRLRPTGPNPFMCCDAMLSRSLIRNEVTFKALCGVSLFDNA